MRQRPKVSPNKGPQVGGSGSRASNIKMAAARCLLDSRDKYLLVPAVLGTSLGEVRPQGLPDFPRPPPLLPASPPPSPVRSPGT